jgi:subtilisin family serine protease
MINKKITLLLIIGLFISLLTINIRSGNINKDAVNEKKKVIIALIDTGIDYTHKEIKDIIMYDNVKPIGKNFISSEKDIKDDNGHGTHIAVIVARIAGSKVSIITGKVLDLYGNGKVEYTADAIKWAANNKAKIIVISLGTPFYSKELKNSVEFAWNKGCLLLLYP